MNYKNSEEIKSYFYKSKCSSFSLRTRIESINIFNRFFCFLFLFLLNHHLLIAYLCYTLIELQNCSMKWESYSHLKSEKIETHSGYDWTKVMSCDCFKGTLDTIGRLFFTMLIRKCFYLLFSWSYQQLYA